MTNYNGKEVLNGLLFIKSMMSVENVERQAIALRKLANKAGVDCNHALLDDSYSKSIDRDAICDLLEYLDTGRYQVLVVEDVYDLITRQEVIKIRNLSSEIQNIKNQINELERLKNHIPVIVVRKIDDYYINEKNGERIDLSTLSDNTTVIDDIPWNLIICMESRRNSSPM